MGQCLGLHVPNAGAMDLIPAEGIKILYTRQHNQKNRKMNRQAKIGEKVCKSHTWQVVFRINKEFVKLNNKMTKNMIF